MSTEQQHVGPFVKGAFLCESVIEGKDGMNSYIKVLDRMTLEARVMVIGQAPPGVVPPRPPLPENMPEGQMISNWLVLMLVGGGAQGRMALTLRMRGPDGIIRDLAGPVDVYFDARPSSGINLHMHLQMMLQQEGPYEILVALDGQEITRVFFDLLYQRTA